MSPEEFASLKPCDLVEWREGGTQTRYLVVQCQGDRVGAVDPSDMIFLTNATGWQRVDETSAAEPPRAAPTASPATPCPPLGILPRWLWVEKRCTDLARAIHERIDAAPTRHYPWKDVRLSEWVEELASLMRESKFLNVEDPENQRSVEHSRQEQMG
jgi:hypothetical protein